jgi:hypothetical protein
MFFNEMEPGIPEFVNRRCIKHESLAREIVPDSAPPSLESLLEFAGQHVSVVFGKEQVLQGHRHRDLRLIAAEIVAAVASLATRSGSSIRCA